MITCTIEHPGVPHIGLSRNLELHLAECILYEKYYKLYFDNWFTIVKLMAWRTVQQISLLRGAFDEYELQKGH